MMMMVVVIQLVVSAIIIAWVPFLWEVGGLRQSVSKPVNPKIERANLFSDRCHGKGFCASLYNSSTQALNVFASREHMSRVCVGEIEKIESKKPLSGPSTC